jgi:hypothetical protein
VAGYVEGIEGETHVAVRLWDGDSSHHLRSTGLSPEAARAFADQLYRLANRIDRRHNRLAPQAMGGRARAQALTSEQRSEIARNAAKARWGKKGKTNG